MKYRHDGDHQEAYTAITVEYITVLRGIPNGQMFTVLAHRRISRGQASTMVEFDVTVGGVAYRSTIVSCEYALHKQVILTSTPWKVIPLEAFIKRYKPQGEK
jgi:hypothetical protein